MTTTRFLITADIPSGMSKQDMADYIAEAISGWRGGYERGHPLVGMDLKLDVQSKKPPTEVQKFKETTARPWGQVVLEHLPKRGE